MNNDCYLKIMADLNQISATLSIKYYIWGGFVQDIMEGDFLRDHKDIDIFIENLEDHKDQLVDFFLSKGYECKFVVHITMLEIGINGKHASINSLMYKAESAIWKHIGDRGFISFPKEWLDDSVFIFHGITVRVSGLKFEFCFRSMIGGLNPEWKPREKDVVSLRYYDGMIVKYSIPIEVILSQIWSYNPFWQDKGYCGYKEPVIVLGKEYIEEAQQRVRAGTVH